MRKELQGFTFILVLLLSFNFVFAQGFDTPVSEIHVPNIFQTLFGFPDISTIGEILVFIVIFIMLAVAFSDIFSLFTGFSKPATSWILGFGLAFIVAVSRGLLALTRFIFTLAGGVGVFSVAIIIITAFLAATIIHLGFGVALQQWAVRRQIAIEALKEAKKPAEAWEKLQKFEELTKESGGLKKLANWIPLIILGAVVLLIIIFLLIFR